jgi:small subunit ribosomal protein S17
VGTVVGTKMQKTIRISVERRVSHPLYGKQVVRTKTLYAHDEASEAREGDVVRVVETRPLSRLKRWRVVEIVERAK